MMSLVFVATLINFIDRLTVTVLAPVIVDDLKLTNQQYGAIATWFLVAYTASHALSGRLYDHIGVKRGLSFSIVLWSLAAMAHATARSAAGLSVFRFLLGLGEAGNWPAAAKVAAEWFQPRQRALAMAIFNSGAALGSVIAPPFIVFLQLRFGWQATFVVTGSLGFAWLILWLWAYQPAAQHRWITEGDRGELPPNAVRAKPSPYRDLVRRKQTWGIIAARCFTDPAWWLYLTWLPLYLNRVHGLDLKQIAWAAPIPYLAADVGSFAGGGGAAWLMSRGWSINRARKTLILVGASMMCAGIGIIWAKSLAGALFFISLVTFGFQAWVNNVQTLPSDYFRQSNVAAVAGLGGMGAGVGSVAFMQLTGWLVDRAGYSPVLAIAAAMPAIGTLALLALSGEVRSLEQEPS